MAAGQSGGRFGQGSPWLARETAAGGTGRGREALGARDRREVRPGWLGRRQLRLCSARFEQEQEERRGRGTRPPRGDKVGGEGRSTTWESGIGPTARLHAGSCAEYGRKYEEEKNKAKPGQRSLTSVIFKFHIET
jgi:hypothetical protein